jgi:hypothetical protein
VLNDTLLNNIEKILIYYKDEKTDFSIEFILYIIWLLGNITAGPIKNTEKILFESDILRIVATLNLDIDVKK